MFVCFRAHDEKEFNSCAGIPFAFRTNETLSTRDVPESNKL